MLEPVQLIPAGSPLWAGYLAHIPHDFYFGEEYHAFMQQQGYGEAWLAVAGSDEKYVAWPFLLRRLEESPGLRDVTSVYGYSGPLAYGCEPDDPFLASAWQSLVARWHDIGAVSLFCRFHPVIGNQRWFTGPAFAPLELIYEGPTVSLDLARTTEEARAGYRETHRRHINRARRAGLVCEVDHDFEHLRDFARLYRDTMTRNCAAAEYFYTAEFFDQMRQKLDPAITLHVARSGSSVAAAALVSEYGGIVQYMFGGVNGEFFELSPLKLLLDSVREWGRARGNRVMHLGGGRGAREDSLFYFKSGFSNCHNAFYTGRCTIDPELYRSLSERRQVEARRNGKVADPHYFPAYRAPLAEDGHGATSELGA